MSSTYTARFIASLTLLGFCTSTSYFIAGLRPYINLCNISSGVMVSMWDTKFSKVSIYYTTDLFYFKVYSKSRARLVSSITPNCLTKATLRAGYSVGAVLCLVIRLYHCKPTPRKRAAQIAAHLLLS